MSDVKSTMIMLTPQIVYCILYQLLGINYLSDNILVGFFNLREFDIELILLPGTTSLLFVLSNAILLRRVGLCRINGIL